MIWRIEMAMFTPQALKDLDTSKVQEAPKGRFPTGAVVLMIMCLALLFGAVYLLRNLQILGLN